MDFAQLTQLISGGGVVAFAGLVWWSLRDFKAELQAHREEETETRQVIAELGKTLALVLEHVRFSRGDTGPIRYRAPSEREPEGE